MIRQKNAIKTILFLVLVLFTIQGCIAKKETVKLMEVPVKKVSCNQALSDGVKNLSKEDLDLALDRALFNNELTCWKDLMTELLMQERSVSMKHLAKAVHVFNKNESENEFSLAVYQYFLGIIKGKGRYLAKEQNLMKSYVSFEIRNARAKSDTRLKRAKLVCKRLDKQLYEKFFL
jgi:hypothetical protein